MIARVRHALRLFGATVLGALVAGAVAGLGARVAMWVIRLMNDSHNGEVTHANYAMGQWTVEGTLNLVISGALFMGVPGAFLYLLVRRWLPGRSAVKGLAYGVVLLALMFTAMLDDNTYEYTRYVSPAVSVPLFALLFPIFGVMLAGVAERLGRGDPAPPSNRVVRVVGRGLLLAFVVLSAVGIVEDLRDSFGLFA